MYHVIVKEKTLNFHFIEMLEISYIILRVFLKTGYGFFFN